MADRNCEAYATIFSSPVGCFWHRTAPNPNEEKQTLQSRDSHHTMQELGFMQALSSLGRMISVALVPKPMISLRSKACSGSVLLGSVPTIKYPYNSTTYYSYPLEHNYPAGLYRVPLAMRQAQILISRLFTRRDRTKISTL